MPDTPSYYHPVDPSRHHRERLWDYHGRAIYHITLTTADRYPLFGKLSGDTAESTSISLNPFGKEVNRMLHDLPTFFAPKGISLKVLAVMVMPDHLHLVLQVLEPMPKSIGEEELQDTLLEQAQSGVVTLSAAISPGEKQIARLIRESHLPLVILLKDGFPPAGSTAEQLYKPGGVYFDACAAGHLLLLEPTADVFSSQEVADAVYRRSPMATSDSQRYHFLALNHIASRLASLPE